jgi:GT2 family glycosyltransferase
VSLDVVTSHGQEGGATSGSAPTPFLLCTTPGSGDQLMVAALRSCGLVVRDDAWPVDRLVECLVGIGAAAPACGALTSWADFAPAVVEPVKPDPSRCHPDGRPHQHTVLEQPLPGLRFVLLVRRDKEAQARATRGAGGDPVNQDADPATLSAGLRSQDWRWIAFFTAARVEPLVVAYEDLVADCRGTVRRVLTFLAPDADHSVEHLPVSVDDATDGTRVVRNPAPARRPTRGHGLPPVSIVVVSHNEGEKLPLTVGGLRATVPDSVEMVVVDDWSTDGSVEALDPGDARVVRTAERGGVTGARNSGAAAATGDVLVFADAHVVTTPGWLQALCASLADDSVACVGPAVTQIHAPRGVGHGFTWAEPQLRMRWLRSRDPAPHPVPFVCGCFMAFRRSDFEAAGGFDPGLLRWGSEDAEIGLHLWRRGRASVVVPQAQVAHLFRPAAPYEVPPHLVVHNTLRTATAHLPRSAVRAVIASLQHLSTFPAAYAELVEGDVWERRDVLARTTVHDGSWFLDRFRIGALR